VRGHFELREDGAGEVLDVVPEVPVGRAWVWHGYGQAVRETLGALVTLAGLGFAARARDLPGHGRHPGRLELETLERALDEAHGWLRGAERQLVVGFSLGGRLALRTGEGPCVTVSAPAVPTFEGPLDELWRELSPHRVREARPLAGLESVLAAWGDRWEPTGPTLAIHGARDLESVRRWAPDQQQHPGTRCVRVARANHAGTWHDPRTWQAVAAWVREGFPSGGETSWP
jgi:pimeloyl-ACP methyl ester carboxylesterase